MTDRELLMALLGAKLTDQQIEVFGGELARMELGHVPALSPRMRGHAEAIARAKGVIPPAPPVKKSVAKRNEWHREDDPYCAKRTPGTEFAERLLARPMPTPTPLRRAGGRT